MGAFTVSFTPSEVCYASGLSPQGTRTKRYNGSTTDELAVQPDGFVECDMRAAGPYLPDLPWETCKLRFDHPLHEASVPKAVRKICTDEGLTVHNIDIFDCFYLYLKDKTTSTVGRITVQGENSQRNWIAVARMVHKHLVDNGFTDTGAEVCAEALEERPSVFSVFESDEIAALWEEVIDEVRQELGLEGVVAMGCFRMGAGDTANECPPTIFLGREPTVQREWKSFRDQILAILDRHELGMVGVLIKKDRPWGAFSVLYNRHYESDEDVEHVQHVGDRDISDIGSWTDLRELEEENPGESEVEG